MPPLPVGRAPGVSVAGSVRQWPRRAALGSRQPPGEPTCPRLPGHVRSLALEVPAFNTGKLQTRGRGTRGAAQSQGGSAVGGPRFPLPGGRQHVAGAFTNCRNFLAGL